VTAAAVHMSAGGDKYREAANLYQEMLQRYGDECVGPSNGLAAAYICMKNYQEAEKVLLEALAREPENPDTLINLITVQQHTGKGSSDAASQYLITLKRVAPGHPMVASLALAEGSFERVAAGFAAAGPGGA
jgi:coatomer protein complex subunit epsilon